jgi:hypothetical protein
MTSNPPKTIFINVGCYFYDNNNKVISKIRNEFCLSTTLNFINREEDNIVTGKRLRRYHWADQFIFSPNGNVLMQTSQASVIIYWHIE